MSSYAAEAHCADWPAEGGSSASSGRSGKSQRLSSQDAPAAAPISEQGRHARRVVVHRRSSSSSSTTIVVHNYEMKSTSATSRDVAPDSAHGSRRPANYAHSCDNQAETAAAAAVEQRHPFSQANKLPSAAASSSASQRAVNQVRSTPSGSTTSASGRPIESLEERQRQQKPEREQRQIMNNNNKSNCANSPTNYDVGRNGATALDATGNTGHKRSRQAQIAPDAANDDEELEDADYSLIDTPDLQRHSNGNHGEPSRRQHSASTQMNRSHFYNNLFKTNNEASGGQATVATKGAANHRGSGRRPVHEQSRMGAARRAKSATLPARESRCTDFGYDEIGPPAVRNGQQQQQHQRFNRQQVVAHGQAIRNDLITSMKSPQRASMRLAENGHQSSARPTNGSSDNNSMAPYGSFGSSSQRASRSTLSARSARVGKFVNYYPASRQPQPSSPSHKRHTSPYAFHVPPHRLRSPTARARSPYCLYGSPTQLYNAYGEPVECLLDSDEYDLVRRVGAAGHEHANQEEEDDEEGGAHLVAKAEIKQTRYGYVAPLDRIESKQRPMALSKFNKSLKSRTIGHLPSMVQVSVDDNLLAAPRSTHLSESRELLADSYNNRSEGDLLKAHRIVWRNANNFDAGYDNPFKPGTELSLEADLMVRLIKRGYPIDELPHLVQATKEVMAAKQLADLPATRSKSCDKLAECESASRDPKAAGYLNSNLRQFNEQAKTVRGDLDESRGKRKCVHSVSHSHLLHSDKLGTQDSARTVDDLEPCKRIWANSLSRAKSMPRFNYTAKGEGGNKLKSPSIEPATMKDDVDSLDKLISDIEREISDLLVSESSGRVASGLGTKESHAINGTDEDSVAIESVSTEAVKTKQRSAPKRKVTTPNSSPKRPSRSSAGQETEKLVSSVSTPSFAEAKKTREKNDLTSSRSDELLLATAGNSKVIVKKKSKCCLIL